MAKQHAEALVERLNTEAYPKESIQALYAVRWTLFRLGQGKDPRRYVQSPFLTPDDRKRIRALVDLELAR